MLIKRFIAFALAFFALQAYVNSQHLQYNDLRKDISKFEVLDSAKLRITYSLKYLCDSTKYDKISDDRKILLIGDKINHFYSYYVRQSDSVMTADFSKNKKSAPVKRAAGIHGEGYDIYTENANNKRTVVERITNYSIYKYDEELLPVSWKITNETNEIMGYNCIKATGKRGGRDYEVWFTDDIPISAGPWKLDGLPGLILRANDSRNNYIFECIGIERLKNKQAIILPKLNYINVSRKEYMKELKKFNDDHINSLLNIGINLMLRDDNGTFIKMIPSHNKSFEEKNAMIMRYISLEEYNRKKRPYNPIELE